MNDRFKFRVWNKSTNSFTTGGAIKFGGLCFVDEEDFGIKLGEQQECYIIEQCTGLKDKNGNLIYEGDIIRCEIDVKRELTVVWDDGCFGVYVPLNDEFVKFYPLGNFSKHEWDVKNIEIIGNVHEQAEQKDVK